MKAIEGAGDFNKFPCIIEMPKKELIPIIFAYNSSMIDGNAKQIPKHKGDILRVAVNYICYIKPTKNGGDGWKESSSNWLVRTKSSLKPTRNYRDVSRSVAHLHKLDYFKLVSISFQNI